MNPRNTTNSNPIFRFFARRNMQRMDMNAESARWGIDFINKLRTAEDCITVLNQFPVFSRIEMDKKWSKSTIRQLRFFDAFKALNIVQLGLGMNYRAA